jgi:hypothetical protein
MVSMSDELKECNILKLILVMRFACATLDVGHPIISQRPIKIFLEAHPEPIFRDAMTKSSNKQYSEQPMILSCPRPAPDSIAF